MEGPAVYFSPPFYLRDVGNDPEFYQNLWVVLNLARADEAPERKRCGESRAIFARPAWFAASVARTLDLTAPSP